MSSGQGVSGNQAVQLTSNGANQQGAQGHLSASYSSGTIGTGQISSITTSGASGSSQNSQSGFTGGMTFGNVDQASASAATGGYGINQEQNNLVSSTNYGNVGVLTSTGSLSSTSNGQLATSSSSQNTGNLFTSSSNNFNQYGSTSGGGTQIGISESSGNHGTSITPSGNTGITSTFSGQGQISGNIATNVNKEISGSIQTSVFRHPDHHIIQYSIVPQSDTQNMGYSAVEGYGSATLHPGNNFNSHLVTDKNGFHYQYVNTGGTNPGEKVYSYNTSPVTNQVTPSGIPPQPTDPASGQASLSGESQGYQGINGALQTNFQHSSGGNFESGFKKPFKGNFGILGNHRHKLNAGLSGSITGHLGGAGNLQGFLGGNRVGGIINGGGNTGGGIRGEHGISAGFQGGINAEHVNEGQFQGTFLGNPSLNGQYQSTTGLTGGIKGNFQKYHTLSGSFQGNSATRAPQN
ncbi:uncharacterized transmembrane protein DDB_G0289901-like [Homalodisca vitripennis]|uniref:uncharacterized transmembrane protein DDB_G0289901-like n=1 Tax=Homalodisca vitripennis TaxID=197043 RepID=UPI001EEB6D6C|nr:uncharacterized transmembrane protein DDB_G0289901-like [Homalodisca vitripennis]